MNVIILIKYLLEAKAYSRISDIAYRQTLCVIRKGRMLDGDIFRSPECVFWTKVFDYAIERAIDARDQLADVEL